ncbi:MAG: 4Fe-4S binding protein [Candidatus Thermoplasmatota archaeon]|nr:4Fe-4S binding protein [Candidatus Thermoplasmatota archaeon]
MLPVWSKEACIECVACVGSCPIGALRYTTNRRIVVDRDVCTGCGQCALLCPIGALKMVKEGAD